MKDIHTYYWTPKLLQSLRCAGTNDLEDITGIAIEVLGRMPGRVEMVFGPNSNMTIFGHAMHILWHEENRLIFSQLPFESKLREFKSKWDGEYPEDKCCWPIMLNFYRRLFLSERIAQGHFLYGWETSTESIWQHEDASRFGVEIRHLPKELTERVSAL